MRGAGAIWCDALIHNLGGTDGEITPILVHRVSRIASSEWLIFFPESAVQHDEPSGITLVVGDQGMLGRAWHQLLKHLRIHHRGLNREIMDITDEESVVRQISDETRLVVNTAAFTDVDGAEQDPDLAHRVNGTAVGYLADRCHAVGATLIHYSTDYVFNGRASQPYAVTTSHDPINTYGRSKAAGENLVRSSRCDHLMIRTSWLYAPWGRNFVRTMFAALRERDSVRVVADQRGRPTSATHLARTSWELYLRGARGAFHICDEGDCSWHEFAQELARVSDAPGRVQACTTAEFPRPAPRPTYSVLDLSQTTALLGALPTWQQNLAEVVREW